MLNTFQVPVKPHVRKYLLKHLGEDYKLSQLDSFGRHLKILLELNRKKKYWDGFTGRYTASFGVSMEGNVVLQKRLRSLKSKLIIDFNNFVEGIIKGELYSMVDTRRDFGLSQYRAIQAFREKYDFNDEDISHETLKKAWQRYVKDKADGANSTNSGSVCPQPVQAMAA